MSLQMDPINICKVRQAGLPFQLQKLPQASALEESPTLVVLSLFCHHSHGPPEIELRVSQPITSWMTKGLQWINQATIPFQIISWATRGVSRAKKQAVAHMKSHMSWDWYRFRSPSAVSSQVSLIRLGKGANNIWTSGSPGRTAPPAIKCTGHFDLCFRVWRFVLSAWLSSSPLLHGYVSPFNFAL